MAWLDVAKTPQQLKPYRIVHRMADVLSNFESLKMETDRAAITKDMPRKKVKRGGVDMGETLYGKWQWSPVSAQHYSADQLKHAEEWAASE